MDFAAAKKVRSLIGSLTDTKAAKVDEILVKHLKLLLRGSDELVGYAQACLLDRLGTSNSQSRKLALELCDILFSRSKAFRQALATHFTRFVELTVGHKSDTPLPPPAAAAVALRDRALEVIEAWHETWGVHYPQVTIAYKYLKKQYKFPDISSRAAAAAAEQAAQQQQRQQMLLARYQQFTQDFPQQRQQLHSLLKQLQECFELLQQPVPQKLQHEETDGLQQQEQGEPQQQMQQQQLLGDGSRIQPEVTAAAVLAARGSTATAVTGGSNGETAAPTADVEGDAWEDVEPQQQQQQQQAGGSSVSVDADFDMDELVGDFLEPTVPDPDHVARNATVLEQLSDLARQAKIATTTPLLDWLRLLTQLHLQDEQQQQERQRLLRAVVDLRAQLQAYLQHAAAWGVSTGPGQISSAQQPADESNPAAATSSPLAPAAAAVVSTDAVVFAAAGAAAAGAAAAAALGRLPSRSQQPLHIQARAQSHNSGAANVISFGSNVQRHLGQTPQQQQQQQGVEDVYATLRDPTAAVVGAYTISKEVVQRNEASRWHMRHPSSDSSEGEEEHHKKSPTATATAAATATDANSSGAAAVAVMPPAIDCGAKFLEPSLRQKLLASAPKLPVSGTDWLVAHKAVAHHGMELYNHWGAVDAAVTIPHERLQQLVGYSATYYKPKKKAKPQSVPAAAAAAGRGCVHPDHGNTADTDPAGHGSIDAASDASVPVAAAAAASACAGGSSRPQSVQQQQQSPADLGSRSLLESAPATTVPAAAEATIPSSSAAGGSPGSSQQLRKRPRMREASAAHNREVLASALTDESVAAALQQQLDEQAAVEAAAARGGSGRGRGRKAPERKGDKVRKKLLGLK